MSVLLNLPSILSISPSEFDKFNNTGAKFIIYDTKIALNSRFSRQNMKISPLENTTFVIDVNAQC